MVIAKKVVMRKFFLQFLINFVRIRAIMRAKVCAMTAKEAPQKISLTAEEADALKSRVQNSKDLSATDIKIINGLISFCIWLQSQLNLAKISIHRLKKIFGFSTEKKSL